MIPQTSYSGLGRFSGSFWRTHLKEASRRPFRLMRETMADGSAASIVEQGTAQLFGRPSIVSNVLLGYTYDGVVGVGADLHRRFREAGAAGWVTRRPRDDEEWFFTETVDIGFPGFFISNSYRSEPLDSSVQQWWVPIPFDLEPLVIAGKDRVLVSGVDFRCLYGFIETRVSPFELFDGGRILVLRGRRHNRCALGFSFGSDGGVNDVAHYYRKAQHPDSWLAAGCQAAGLSRVPEDCTVLGQTPNGYVTTAGRIVVPYGHKPLEIGTALAGGSFIGAAPAMSSVMEGDYVAGLDMAEFSPWALRIPPGNIRVDVVSGAPRPFLLGDEEVRDAYWAELAKAATAFPAISVAQVLFGSTANGSYQKDWLTLVHEQILVHHAWIVRLSAPDLDPQIKDRLKRFLRRERLLGKMVLFIPEPPPES